MDELTDGRLSDAQIAGVLASLTGSLISPEALAGFATVLRRKKRPFASDRKVLDTCGTGGDGLGTFNISSLAAVVAASCGALVAKHGNRGVSSPVGSADFYRALGVRGGRGAVRKRGPPAGHRVLLPVRADLPRRHAPRREGPQRAGHQDRHEPRRTAFQSGGRLLPAHRRLRRASSAVPWQRRPTCWACGGSWRSTGRTAWTRSPSARGRVSWRWTRRAVRRDYYPQPRGVRHLPPLPVEELRGGTAAENAVTAQAVLGGAGPAAIRDAVLLNAGAALYICGLARNIGDGYARAQEALQSGAGRGEARADPRARQGFARRPHERAGPDRRAETRAGSRRQGHAMGASLPAARTAAAGRLRRGALPRLRGEAPLPVARRDRPGPGRARAGAPVRGTRGAEHLRAHGGGQFRRVSR